MSRFTLTPGQRALLPDDSDVALYEVNGYYISKEGVLPEALIDSACEGPSASIGGRGMALFPSTPASPTGNQATGTGSGTASSFTAEE
jgi:hypothetical protein